MTRHRRLSWCAALLACVLAACSAERPHARPTAQASAAAPSPNSVNCAHDIGGRPPDDNFRLVLDAVALPTGVLESHDSGRPGRLFAKAGLLVRAGTPSS